MHNKRRLRRLWDEYRFPGFRPSSTVEGVFGDRRARIVTLIRRSKKRRAGAVLGFIPAGTIARNGSYATSRTEMPEYTCGSRCGAYIAGDAMP